MAVRALIVAGMLVGTALRLYGLNALEVFGNSASSIFFASRDIPELIRTTAADSHPPIYYLLLRAFLEVFGWSELWARLPSLFSGILTLAVMAAAGRTVAGQRGAVLAIWLAALHPVLVYYSRLPRMYALLVLLSMLVLLAATRRKVVLAAVLAWFTLMVHYLAVVPVGIAGLVVIWQHRHARGTLIRSLVPFAVVVLAWLPWLAYALPASFSHTARTISGVPPPETLLHFLGSLAAFGPVGTFVSYEQSVVLSIVFWVAVVVAFVAGRRSFSWPLVTLGLALAGAAIVYLAVPAFGRPRFFIVLVPLAVLAVVALPGKLGLAVQAVAAVVFAFSLVPTYWLERNVFELENRRLATLLAGSLSHHDAVVLQPWWQAGYLALHGSRSVDTYDLRDVSVQTAPNLLGDRRSVWLVMTSGVGRRDPAFPIEEWLDGRYFRVDERTIGSIRVVRYAEGIDVSAPSTARNGFGAVVAAQSVAAGAGLPVLTAWTRTTNQLVAFLHLDGPGGRGWAGRDGEPQDGLLQSNALAGTVFDKRGLAVPRGTPPGTYTVNAGLYRRDNGQTVGDQFSAGSITVTPAAVTGRTLATFGQSLDLIGIAILPADPVRADRIVVPTVDGSQTLTFPIDAAPGQPVGIELAWRSRGTLPPLTGFVHVLDAQGNLVAQSDAPPAGGAYPTDTWQPETAVYDLRSLSLPDTLSDGTYTLIAGWYDGSDTRLPITSSLTPATTVPVGHIVVKR